MVARIALSRRGRWAWCGVLLWSWLAAGLAVAQENKGSAVPLKKVVLFNSGVGFFERTAEINGTAQVDLKFNVDDINDLLKSMVLQDLGGGQISTVSYGSRDPITRTLRTFAIDLTSNPTLADLLAQVRGEQVQVNAPGNITGTIVGIEKRTQRVGENQSLEVQVLNLLTEEGLRSVPLDSVGRIKLLNEQLDQELRQALTILAMGHATDKKTVTLNFVGQGKRPVRVGYIQETPIWKTSYRLVLKDEEAPFLQGWAIVENTTEEDWDQVALTLVSGRPISFVMDLYQPLYVSRPVVEPELFASLRPQTYTQDLANAERDFLQAQNYRAKKDEAFDGRRALDKQAEKAAAAPAADGLARGLGAAGQGGYLKNAGPGMLDPRQSAPSVAQASDVGEMFQYVIANAVNLERQKSAMLPIVNGSVQGQKVSIYNPGVHAKHPLNGLRLTNTTGLHLMQGPITVFDGGAYAGDAQIQDLQPGTERLISYAMDLDTEVAPLSKGAPEELVSCQLAKGLLRTTRKYSRTQEYTVKNSGGKTKTVLIEFPLDSAWTLVQPEKPSEKTRDMYRFAVQAEPGKPQTLSVQEQRIVGQEFQLTNLDDNTIRFYINAKVVSGAIKTALGDVIKQKLEIADVVGQKNRLEAQIRTIDQEQARIRQNMTQLDRTSDLYSRYVKKFGEQEDEIEALRAQIAELQGRETALRKKLDDFLLGLNLT